MTWLSTPRWESSRAQKRAFKAGCRVSTPGTASIKRTSPRLEDERCHCRFLDRILIPTHRVVLDHSPFIDHVVIVIAGRVTAFARRDDPLAVVKIAEVHDHAHRRNTLRPVGIAGIPTAMVNGQGAASDSHRAVIDQALNHRDSAGSQRFTAK